MAGPAYEIRVVGSVPIEALRELGPISVTVEELRTVFTGTFRDQSELYGFLHRLRAFGLDLVEVRCCGNADAAESVPQQTSEGSS